MPRMYPFHEEDPVEGSTEVREDAQANRHIWTRRRIVQLGAAGLVGGLLPAPLLTQGAQALIQIGLFFRGCCIASIRGKQWTGYRASEHPCDACTA